MVESGGASSLISRVSCASINYYIHLPLARRVVRGDSAPAIQPKMKVSWERDNNYYKTLGDKVRVIKRRLKAWAPRLMMTTLGRQCSDLVRAWVDGNYSIEVRCSFLYFVNLFFLCILLTRSSPAFLPFRYNVCLSFCGH